MGETTGISWCHHTFNPWAGCVKVSPACDNCYAEIETKRYGFVEWGKDADRRRTSETYWKQIAKWNRQAKVDGERRRVFCGSWCDIMEEREDLDPIRKDLYPLIEASEYLDFLLLTKRPQNFRRLLPKSWLANPLPNVLGMTTVESSEYLWRSQELAITPFAVRGLSIEPMLGPIDLMYPKEIFPDGPQMCCNGIDCGCMGKPVDPPLLCDFDWVIVGGESQAGARPMRIEWVRALRDQCVAANVAFHFKQWGEHNAELIHIGKKAAGRELDGRTWDEVPR